MTSYPDSRIITTSYGQVQGRRLVSEGDKQVDAFQGIPFAAPPVGELRFKKPVPPASWSGVKAVKAFGARSIQDKKLSDEYLQNGPTAEDCLHLNVFTPCWEAPKGGFPVMVFIHGGGFLNGEASGYGDVHICENIVTRGVVFVTIQYRLGHLGFFTTGDAVCRGNFGLWDQVEALKWVQANIAAFGGDKDNVTLVGQSAGAASVDLLHLSPHSTNLFHKAIIMAGSAECRWANNTKIVENSLAKVARLGIEQWSSSEELLDKLRLLPAEQFSLGLYTQVKGDCDFETGPYIDGDFFPASSFDELRRKTTPKPFLTGVTQEEGLLGLIAHKITPDGLQGLLKECVCGVEKKEEMTSDVRSRFVPDSIMDDKEKLTEAMAGLGSDYSIVAGVMEHCTKTLALQDPPVFLYVFEHYTSGMMSFLEPMMHFKAATHTCELFYLFKKGAIGEVPMNEKEQHVVDIFTGALTNFAKFGNPNGGGATSELPVAWTALSKSHPYAHYTITSDQPTMTDEAPFNGRTLDFIDIYNKYK